MRSNPSLHNSSEPTNPDLSHFPLGNFLTYSLIIVSSVSGNSLQAHKKTVQKFNPSIQSSVGLQR
jgi:hypothetical protein